ncbi:MAG: type II toxin-antitoxin system PemK/MazF family toxin [Burkholderiales bacterium]|nr:type II toxin-antitoxin system PemK/MazF family toxin [Anaerolineae bacterium]
MMTTMQPKPSYKRGDVILTLFPNSDLQSAKMRPALIVQADNLNTGIAQIVVAMISTNLQRAGHPARLTVLHDTPVGQQSGLLFDSVVMTDNLATVAEAAIRRTVGSLPMDEVDNALRHTLSL